MLYIVRFKFYYLHGFIFNNANPLLSLTPQNTYNMLATDTTNNTSYQTTRVSLYSIQQMHKYSMYCIIYTS